MLSLFISAVSVQNIMEIHSTVVESFHRNVKSKGQHCHPLSDTTGVAKMVPGNLLHLLLDHVRTSGMLTLKRGTARPAAKGPLRNITWTR